MTDKHNEDFRGKVPDHIQEMHLENDLGWLKDLKVHELDGKLLLGEPGEELPFNVSHVIEEKEFVQKWLIPFALGNSTGVNYFPFQEWCSFTFNGTRSVLVVARDAETGKYEPTLLVPPIISNSLTADDRYKLRMASLAIYNISEDNRQKENLNASLKVANALADSKIGLEAKPTTLTDLITPAFFEKFSVVPEVERKVYWIRDVIRKGTETNPDDLTRARALFFKEHKGETLTQDELKFLNQLSLGDYEIEDRLADAPSEQADNESPDDPDFDPLAC